MIPTGRTSLAAVAVLALLSAGCDRLFSFQPGQTIADDAGVPDGPQGDGPAVVDGGEPDGARLDGGADGAPDGAVDSGPDGCPATAVCTQTDGGCWCWESPLPQGNTLNGLWAPANQDTVYAVGDRGTLLRYDKASGGWTPRQIRLGTLEDLNAISGSSSSEIFVVGDNATAFRFDGIAWHHDPVQSVGAGLDLRGVWTDGTLSFAVGTGGAIYQRTAGGWQGQDSPASEDLNAVYGVTADEAFAVGNGGTIVRYRETAVPYWTVEASGLTTKNLTSVWGTSERVFATAPGLNTPHLLYRDGNGWHEDTSNFGSGAPQFNALWGTSLDNTWAVGGRAYRYATANGWTPLAYPPPAATFAATGITASSNPIVAGEWGTIATWAGVGWDQFERFRVTDRLRGIWMASSGTRFALSYEGTLLESANGGAWSPTDLSATLFYTIWGLDADNLLLAGSSIHRVDSNRILYEEARPTGVTFFDLWGDATGTVFAVGNRANAATLRQEGRIFRRIGPADWEEVHSDLGKATIQDFGLWAIWGTTQAIYAVGDEGRILRSATGDAGSWTPMESGTGTELRGIWGSAPDDVYAVGNGGEVIHYNGTPPWQAVGDTGARLNAVAGNASGDVYAVGERGQVVRVTPTTVEVLPPVTHNVLWDLWVESDGSLTVVGDGGAVLRYTPSP